MLDIDEPNKTVDELLSSPHVQAHARALRAIALPGDDVQLTRSQLGFIKANFKHATCDARLVPVDGHLLVIVALYCFASHTAATVVFEDDDPHPTYRLEVDAG